MKYKRFLNAFSLLLLIVVNINVVYSQTMVDKNMLELKPNKKLIIELQKLIYKANHCDDYNPSLIWDIDITQAENGCVLIITMQDNINVDYEYVGFFYLDKVQFVVSGIMGDSLFTVLESKRLKFKTKDKPKNQIISETPSGDYPNWIYLSKENKLMQIKEYLIPCD